MEFFVFGILESSHFYKRNFTYGQVEFYHGTSNVKPGHDVRSEHSTTHCTYMEPNNSRMGTIGMTIFTFAILLSVRDLLRHKPLVSGDSSRNTDEASSTEEDVTSERDSESTSNNFEDDFAEVSDVEENEPIEVRDTTDFAKTNAKNLKNRFQSSSLTFLYW